MRSSLAILLETLELGGVDHEGLRLAVAQYGYVGLGRLAERLESL